mgnify:CR=1 FL=1
MGEAVFFRNLTTKGLTAVNTGERYFEGFLTVQVKDKQGEVTIVDELMKVLPVWIDRGAPISDTHSNRIIGKGINYSKVEYKDKDGEIYPAIKVTGKIHKNYELDNDIWQKIKSGEYKGLSFGGATKSDREPMRMKDGSIAYSLKDLEHYEVAVCRDPAVPLALITEFNTLAKAVVDGEDLGGGRMLIKCDKYGCYVDKANNSEGGLKAPEARNEALVYDDKTLDQPSETPLENQAKIQKVSDEEMAAKKEKKEKERKIYEDASNCPNCNTHYDWGKVYERKPDCPNCNKKIKKVSDEKAGTLLDEDRAVQSGKVRPPTPKHFVRPTDKGEDWSNADGDRHGMYNQDTDEGGMGKKHTGPKGCKCGDPKCKDPKCKKHKREVGTGHGAEENNSGEVGWSGSGSPYPKKKGDNSKIGARDHTRNAEYKRGEEEQDEVSAEHKTHNTPVPLKSHGKWLKDINGQEYYVEFPEYYPTGTVDSGGKPGKTGKKKGSDHHITQEEWEESENNEKRMRRRKKKAIIINIHTRLKNLDFLLRFNDDKQSRAGQSDQAIYAEELAKPAMAEYSGHNELTSGGKKTGKKDIVESYPGKKGTKQSTKKAVITHIHSRLKNLQTRVEISDFLLRKTEAHFLAGDGKKGKKEIVHDLGCQPHDPLCEQQMQDMPHSNVMPGDDDPDGSKLWSRDSVTGLRESAQLRHVGETEEEYAKRMERTKSYFMRVKDGEFGGMNTGETEWTEPRDTANSRVKRDKDVA